MATQKVYFPALDSLRAIAMLFVFLAHAEPVGGLDVGLWSTGRAGLVLFFILSGFLITYLLLQEQQDRHTINIGNFYLRRILRIWPLYCLIIGICQLLIPYTRLPSLGGIYPSTTRNFGRTTLCYLLFLPNIAFLFVKPPSPFLAHTWTIRAEEQLYLIWPWILQRCGKYLSVVLYLFIGLALLSCWSYEYWFPYHAGKGESWVVLSKINTVLYWSNIEFFALGGLMAFFSLKRPGVAKFLSKKSIQAAAILLSGGLLIGKYYWLNLSVLAIFFSLLVFHATQPGTMMSRLRHPLLIYLGKISYGMYIFHILVMITTAKLLHKLGILQGHNPSVRLIVLPLAFGLTMLAGALSYKWIESFFLRLKKRFTAVPSAPPDPQSL